MLKFLLLVLLFLSAPIFAKKPAVILISIDGFSNNYLNKYAPKNILALAKSGVQAESLIPIFPSKTFPNHLSIITGTYPINHGIIHNRFYHTKLQQTYKMGAGKRDPSWLTALPIWTVAEQQGIKTAIYFWPESEAKVAGILPTYNFPYDGKTTNIKRTNQIIDWLKLPIKDRPQLIVSYFSTVDHAGHKFGPDSAETEQAVKDIDQLIGSLVSRLKNEITDAVNIILVSDHGMMLSGVENSIDIHQLLALPNDVIMVNGHTQLYFYSKNSQSLLDVRSQLKKLALPYKVYNKNNYPAHWHFNDINLKLGAQQSAVIPDLIVEAIPPYNFVDGKKYQSFATHGYDPLNQKKLAAIFIANGPSFKTNISIPAFENIHIFPLLIKLLSLDDSEKIDGNIKELLPILRSETH